MRTLVVDFFKITDSDEIPLDLTAVLAKARDAGKLTYPWGGDFFTFDSIHRAGHIWTGEITRIRPELPVTRGDSTGKADIVPCGPDEGPWWKAVFLHHAETSSVLIERSRSCGPANAFRKFVEERSNAKPPLNLEPLLEKKKWERLANIHDATKFEIKVAGLTNPALLKEAGNSARAIAEFMEMIECPSIQINASIGRGRGYRKLNTQLVKRVAKKLVGLSVDNPQITKIEVGGRVGLEETDVIDLVKGRIFESVALEPSADKTISLENRLDFIRSAWDKRQEEVTALYSEGSS